MVILKNSPDGLYHSSTHQKNKRNVREIMKKFSIKYLHHITLKLFCFLCNDLWVIKGTEKFSEQPLSLLFYGCPENLNYFKHHFFEEIEQEQYLGYKYLWQLRGIFKQHRDSVTIFEGNPFTRLLLKRRNDFFIPSWIKGVYDLPMQVDHHAVASFMKQIRKNNLTYRVSAEKQDVEYFIHNMYLPYMNIRFGNESHAQTESTILKTMNTSKCHVLFVLYQDEPITGMFIVENENKLPNSWLMGVKDGNFDYIKMGGVAAAYYYSADFLTKQGYNRMLGGATRPFLRDGNLAFKRKWGFRVVTCSFTGFLLKPNAYSPGKLSLLQNNPFVFHSWGKLHGAIFIDEGQSHQVYKNRKKFFCNGLDAMAFYRIDGPDNWLQFTCKVKARERSRQDKDTGIQQDCTAKPKKIIPRAIAFSTKVASLIIHHQIQ